MSTEEPNCLSEYVFKPFVFVKKESKITAARPKKPHPRSGHRIACDDANMYSFGGYNPYLSEMDSDVFGESEEQAAPLFKELWRFNISTSSWHKLLCGAFMPNELASNAVILNGSTLIVYGGTGVPFGTTCSNQLYVCNLQNNVRMMPVSAKGELPPKQYGQALTFNKGYLYTVGGTTGYEYSADIHRFNLLTSTWEAVYVCNGTRGEPDGRYRHELAFDGTRIFVMGGGTAVDVYGFEKIPSFNLSTGEWETLVTNGDPNVGVPAARRCHGCVQLPREGAQHSAVFVSGGYDGDHIFNDVWKLDLETLQWHCLSQCRLPSAVYFHSTALTPSGQLFSFGGIADMGCGEYVRTAEVHSAWVCIPKLSEICWEALLHYIPNMQSISKSVLLNIGVPLKFADRIL